MLRLADVLHDWGLTETASVVSRAKARLKALNAFQRLVAEPRSLEMQRHQALEGNVWVFGDEHELLKSNVTLQSVVKRLTDRVYSGGRGQKRPDLLLVGSMGRYLLVELKRPSHTVVHQDVAQRRDIATNRAYIGNQDQRIELAIIGGPESEIARAALRGFDPNGVVAFGPADDVPLLEGKGLVDGAAAVYVCARFACRAPVTEPAALV